MSRLRTEQAREEQVPLLGALGLTGLRGAKWRGQGGS